MSGRSRSRTKKKTANTTGAQINNLTNQVKALKVRARSAPPKQSGDQQQRQQTLDMMGNPTLNHNLLRSQISRMVGSLDKKAMGWLMKSCHPMDEMPTPGDGRIPDQTTGATVTPEGRFTLSIPAPSGISDTTWNCDLWMPNAADSPLVWRVWTSGTNPSGNQWQVQSFPAYVLGAISQDGTTVVDSALVTLADNYRATYKGCSVHLIANSLTNSGASYAAQWAETPGAPTLTTSGSKAELPGQLYNQLPLTEDLLFQKQPGTVTFEARKGIYMPFKYMQSTHTMEESANVGYLAYRADNTGGIQYITHDAGPVSSTNPYAAVTGTTNFQSGMILFRGLNIGATLQVKMRQRLEATPVADGAWAPFGESSPLYNPTVLTQQIRVQQQLALAYPVDYNDAGKILKDIWGFIRGAGKAIGGMKIPFVSDIANIAGGAVDAIGDLF